MKYYSTLLFILLTCSKAHSQIHMADSTVQSIAYWDKGENHSYSVSLEKIKLKGTDTTSKELSTYDVDVVVKDSTEKSYTIEWTYKNFTTTNTSELIKKLMNISSNQKVVFKTDENGSFTEVVNWKEIRDYNQKAIKELQKSYEDIPELNKLLKQLESTYSSKEAIESVSIKDIQQFHTFHGAKFKLGEELKGQIKVPNIYGNTPFDADITLYLDEINESENNYVLRATQSVNKDQLLEATYNYMASLAKSMNITPPKKDELKDLRSETETAARIHDTGWVIYSFQTTTVTADETTNIEERIIELK